METAAENNINQRLLREAELQQRDSELESAVNIRFVVNAVNSMGGPVSVMQKMADGLQRARQAHVDGIVLQSRQEMERLPNQIRVTASHSMPSRRWSVRIMRPDARGGGRGPGVAGRERRPTDGCTKHHE
jgi:hypothetical protein